MFSALDMTLVFLIVAGGVVTLANRLAGHYIMARFEPIPFRVEAALEAVPVAVMITWRLAGMAHPICGIGAQFSFAIHRSSVCRFVVFVGYALFRLLSGGRR